MAVAAPDPTDEPQRDEPVAALPTPTPTAETHGAATIVAEPPPQPTGQTPLGTLTHPALTVVPAGLALGTVSPTRPPTPTHTPEPTATPRPTATPLPTSTSRPTATSRPTRTPTPVAPTVGNLPVIDPQVVEEHVLRLLNQERMKVGAGELRLDSTLSEVARQYSQIMADVESARHQLDRQGVGSRIKAIGYECNDSFRQYGENVAKRPVVRRYSSRGIGDWRAVEYDDGPVAVAEGLVEQWMGSSKGHKEGILKLTFRNVGVGVVVASEYWGRLGAHHPVVYATLNFTTCL